MENIALNKPASASNITYPYTPSRAVDGVFAPFNRWQSNILPCWLNVDLGESFLVNRWVVRHLPVAGWQIKGYVNTEFQLQGSKDNQTWFEIDTVLGNKLSITDRTFPSCEARYFRVFITKGIKARERTASIVELEIYRAPSPE